MADTAVGQTRLAKAALNELQAAAQLFDAAMKLHQHLGDRLTAALAAAPPGEDFKGATLGPEYPGVERPGKCVLAGHLSGGGEDGGLDEGTSGRV